MIKLAKILQEAKQVGIIYHFTPTFSAKDILEQDKLVSKRRERYSKKELSFPTISFTRDKNFWNQTRFGINPHIKFIVDGNKLSEKYKIRPFNWFTHGPKGRAEFEKQGVHMDEMEEVVMAEEIKNLSKYLIGVEYRKNIPNEFAAYQLDIKEIEELCKQKNIPIKAV